MAMLLKGAPVAAAITDDLKQRTDMLRKEGTVPVLAILRIGEREQDLSYERGAEKRCAAAGIDIRRVVLPADISAEGFYDALSALNGDDSVHGVLVFRPLPKHISEEKARSLLRPEKDVDGWTDASAAGVFLNVPTGYAPCTAAGVMAVLDHYGVELSGKNVVVAGRSPVVGRPVSMLLLHKNATVTLCHSKTADMAACTGNADIVIAAIGKAEFFTERYFRPGQVLIDVGINWSEKKQKLCGDITFEEAEPLASAITPVPGGIGAVTTAILARHTVEAAEKARA